MSKKSDDSIERIFRQALTQYDTEFHGDDWLKMEKLLDEEAKRKAAARSRRIKGTAYTLTGLTGLIIAVYFLAIRNPSGSIASRSDSVTEMQASEDLTEKGNVKHENPSESLLSESLQDRASDVTADLAPDNAQSQKRETSEPLIKKDAPITSDVFPNTPIGERPVSEKRTNANSTLGLDETETPELQRVTPSDNEAPQVDQSGLGLTRQNAPPLTSPVPVENVEAVGDKLAEGDGAGNKNPSGTSGESGNGVFQNEGDNDVSQGNIANVSALAMSSENQEALTEKDSSSVDHKLLPGNLPDSGAVVNVANGVAKIKPIARLSVAFVFAPEFSTTSLSNYSSPGESFGLRIGYQLSNKFSISTAFIRSTKKYEDSGEIYKPRNPAYWQIRTNGVIPEQIDSRCLVYELPVAVQFDAIRTLKSRVFLSTAISSYFMISQAYDYTFESPNPGADKGWRSQRSESYWFSVGMVSAGYERDINRSFAIGIEPYLKVSLSEIGWPNVKLFSTGAYLTLRYKFMGRRNF